MSSKILSLVTRLSGQANYDIWCLRMEAVLTEKGLAATIESDGVFTSEEDKKGLSLIRLALDDGPILHIRECKTAAETWVSLQKLYAPRGFSSSILISKELFQTDLESCNHSMEDYLNTVKRLTNELKARSIIMPDELILGWVLNNLTSDYDSFTTNIIQSYRTDSTKINLENLFSDLIDESRRQKSKSGESTAMLVNSRKRKSHESQGPRKRTKCSHCKKSFHPVEKCWLLHPELKPKKPLTSSSANHAVENSDEEGSVEAMHVKVFNSANCNTSDFLLDSACAKHIICDESYFVNFTPKSTMVSWGNASKIRSKGHGDVRIRFTDTGKEAILQNCIFAPEIGVNLISVDVLDQKGFESAFKNGKAILKKGKTLISTGDSRNGVYYLPILPLLPSTQSVFLTTGGAHSDYLKWHLRMAHLGNTSMNYLPKCTKGVSISNKRKNDERDPFSCDVCQKAKFTSQISRVSKFKAEFFLHKVYADLCGPISPQSLGGGRYILLVIDSFTKWAEIAILPKKSQAFDAFIRIKARLENNAAKKLTFFKSDNGTEFKNKRFTELFEATGIIQQFTAPYAHEQNGQVERPNRTLLNKIRALLFSANAPKSYWGEAALAAVYLYNRTPHSSRSFITPFEKRFSEIPDLSLIRVWGSTAYTKNYSAKKLDEKCKKVILVNFGENQYKLLDPETNKTFWSRDVTVFEKPYFSEKHNQEALSTNDIDLENLSTDSVSQIPAQPSEVTVEEQALPIHSPHESQKPNHISRSYRYAGQRVEDLSEDELAAYHTTTLGEPKSYKDALRDPKWDDWKKAMEKELLDLDAQNTWSLVDLPKDKIPLKGRWVYKLKTNSNGDIEKYKARWVIKGFLQQPGIDYEETFCNTARPESWRVMLAEAAKQDWEIHQIDVKSAFPNADIDKEIYTIQPTGFERGTKVCRLHKALYGLKQSARQWYMFLKDILNKFGLVHTDADEGIFYNKDLIIVCHIDDLLIMSSKLAFVEEFKKHIAKSVEITDLGEANFFLGIEITRDRTKRTITLSQVKYLKEIMSRFDKTSLHPVRTPAELGIRLDKSQTTAEASTVQYFQKQIGSLMYLMTKTRPDIAFAVNCCARYMSNPNATHFRALDRIWKYLAGTVDLSLVYNSSEIRSKLGGLTDSDWGGDYPTNRSTTGYLFYYANAPVSWSSRLQKTVALSSCEAEYMGLKEGIKEYVWLQSLFQVIESLRTCDTKTLLTDNQSAIDLSKNPEYHARSKHIDVQYHYVREITQSGKVVLKYVSTKENIAHVLTKPLSPAVFEKFRDCLVKQKGF